jgi:hypothetical protein
MRLISALIMTAGLSVVNRPAAADTLRCGSSLIEVGSSVDEVLAKCGTPTSSTVITEPVWARAVNGRVFQTGTTQAQVWRYDRGPRQFPAILKINEGIVQSIDFDKSPRPSQP